jgi:DTW domain-containing protein YfiP
VRLVVVQHPREHRKPIGTAWMAVRTVRDSHLFVGAHVDGDARLDAMLHDAARPAMLLWPGEGARDLADLPRCGPATLVVVDGTWSTAKKLVERNAVLRGLPRVRITPAQPSRYRIRREPRAECLSTVEAIACALGLLEGAPDKYTGMLAAFERMVDIQIEHEARGGGRRGLLPRGPRPPRRPPVELAGIEDTAVIFAEANAHPYGTANRPPDELLHLVGWRVGDGARLEVFAQPPTPLAPSALRHAELAGDVLDAALAPDAVVAAVEAFAAPVRRLAGWGTYSRDVLGRLGARLPGAFLDLRPLAARTTSGPLGSLEAATERLGLASEPLGRGRAGRRLGMAARLVEHLRAERGGS